MKTLNFTPDHSDALGSSSSRSLLRIYSFYRTLLAGALLLIYSGQWASEVLGSERPQLYYITVLSYTVINTLTLIALWRSNFQARQQQRFGLFAIDVVAICLIVFSSSSSYTSLSYLLIICVACGAMLLRAQIAIALAAFASISLMAINLFRPEYLLDGKSMFAAGSLGALLFITAAGFLYLTHKIKTSNLEAALQAKQAAHLQKLAQTIVERMRTGIMVLDKENRIELVNQSAKKLLNLQAHHSEARLEDLPELKDQLNIWRAYHHSQSPVYRDTLDNTEIKVSFAELEPGDDSDTLVFVEDNRRMTQQAQQLKLASLGRLTASIAHEVRNPLGAISHASQLLAESEGLSEADKRLTEIIQHHSMRVNQIIDNVLQLSRRKAATPEPLELNEWLQSFLEEYRQGAKADANIELQSVEMELKAKFDHSQLRQVLANLIDNGLRHSFNQCGNARVTLRCQLEDESPVIDIIDYGSGIKDDQLNQVFEPFFTTEKTGSGLGLFICKELCEANQASLTYRRDESERSCFRIHFAHPQRTL